MHRKQGEVEKLGISNIGVSKHLYSPIDDSGNRGHATETELSQVEQTLSEIWPSLADDFIDLSREPVRKGISLFLATLFLRHPDAFALQRRVRKQIIEFVQQAPKDREGSPDIEWLSVGEQRMRFDKELWASYVAANHNDEHRFFVEMVRSEAIRMAKHLMKKRRKRLVQRPR